MAGLREQGERDGCADSPSLMSLMATLLPYLVPDLTRTSHFTLHQGNASALVPLQPKRHDNTLYLSWQS